MTKPGEIDLSALSDTSKSVYVIGMTNGQIKAHNAFMTGVDKLSPTEYMNRVRQAVEVGGGPDLISTIVHRRFQKALDTFLPFNTELAPQLDPAGVEFNESLYDRYLERFLRIACPELADIFVRFMKPEPKRRQLRFGSANVITELYGEAPWERLNEMFTTQGITCLRKYAYADDRILRAELVKGGMKPPEGLYQAMWTGSEWVDGDDPDWRVQTR